MNKKEESVLTGCNEAQQFISCLTGKSDSQGKFDTYGVQQREKETRLSGLKVQSQVMTHDLFALKNGAKLWKSPLGGVT